MDMSRLSFAFQQNNIFAVKSPFNKMLGQQQNPVTDVLNQISNKMIDTQARRAELESKIKTQEIKMDSYTQTDTTSALEEALPEALKMFLHICEFEADAGRREEQELTAFRDQLSAFDQMIQEYQDIVDGKTALSGDMTMDDVKNLLATVQMAREQFVQDGVERLNKWCVGDSVKGSSFDHYMQKIFGENKFAGMDISNWQIDPDAPDIYAEIDKALNATRSFTETMDEGVRRIKEALDKMGYGEDKYKLHQDAMRESQEPIPVVKSGTSLQFIMDALEKALERQKEENDQ